MSSFPDCAPRVSTTSCVTVTFRGGVADLVDGELRLDDGSRKELSELEGAVLRYLAVNPGRVVSRDELLERVWRLPANRVRTRTIDMLMVRLREKLGHDDAIVTVRGKGYRMGSA